MTLEQATSYAMEDMTLSKSKAFAVVKVSPALHDAYLKLGWHVYYDYVVFDNYEDLKRYLAGMVSYDYMDATAYIRDDETVVKAYSTEKLIIL